MTMFEILALGLFSFVVFFTVQITTWHAKRIAQEIHWLFVIYLLLPTLATIASAFYFDGMVLDLFLILVIHLVCASVIIFTYPTFKGDIPSLVILKFILNNSGLTRSQIIDKLREDPAFGSRKLDELISEGFVVVCTESLVLSNKAKLIASFFFWYRRLLRSSDAAG